MEKIKISLRRLKFLMAAEKMINIFIFALAMGFIVDFAVIFMSKLVYFHRPFVTILTIHIIGFVLGFFVFMLSLPKTEKVVLKADSLGFKERFITAFELSAKDNLTEIQSLEIEDAVSTAEKIDFRKIYKFNFHKKTALVGFIFLILSFIGYFIPSPFLQTLEAQRQTVVKIEQAAERIDSAEKLLDMEKTYNYEDKSNLLKKLEKDIKINRNEKSAAEKIKNAEIKLKEITDNEKQSIKDLAEIFAENKNLESLADGVANNDINKIENSMDDLNNSLNDLSKEEIEDIGEAFKQAGESLDNSEENSELKGILNDAGEKMEDFADGEADSDQAEDSNDSLKNGLIRQADKNALNEEENLKIGNALSDAENQIGERTNSQKDMGRGHIENDNSGKAETLNKDEAAVKADSQESETNRDAESKRIYVEGSKDDEISYQNKVSEYKNVAVKNAESYNLSNEDKEVVKKYFSDIE